MHMLFCLLSFVRSLSSSHDVDASANITNKLNLCCFELHRQDEFRLSSINCISWVFVCDDLLFSKNQPMNYMTYFSCNTRFEIIIIFFNSVSYLFSFLYFLLRKRTFNLFSHYINVTGFVFKALTLLIKISI